MENPEVVMVEQLFHLIGKVHLPAMKTLAKRFDIPRLVR
jgi:hypothetical protein